MRRMFGFLIGIAVGGLVGSTIALLMAPEAGDDLAAFLLLTKRKRRHFFACSRHARGNRG